MPKIAVLSRRTFLKALTLLPVGDSVQNHPPIAISKYPIPKFWFCQRVRCEWLCDDEVDTLLFGQKLWYIGEIRGMVYNHPDLRLFSPQWSYFVHWTEAHPSLGNDSEFAPDVYAEEELEASL